MPERCVRRSLAGWRAWQGGEPGRERCERGVWVRKRCVRGKASFCLFTSFPSLRCTVGARERRLCSSSEDRHCSELGGV